VVRRFYEAFQAQDLDAFVATLHPHVELQTARGLRIGLLEARAWATRNPAGDLEQRYVVEDLREHGSHVVALQRKQWWWKETDDLAEDEEAAALFTFEDGLISRWQPFTDRAEALAAAGIEP
jgi:ketosteroid isomerase-like protein